MLASFCNNAVSAGKIQKSKMTKKCLQKKGSVSRQSTPSQRAEDGCAGRLHAHPRQQPLTRGTQGCCSPRAQTHMHKGHLVSKLLHRTVQRPWLLPEDHECHLQHSPRPQATSAPQHPLGTNPAQKLQAAADQLPTRWLATSLSAAVKPRSNCSGLAKSQT